MYILSLVFKICKVLDSTLERLPGLMYTLFFLSLSIWILEECFKTSQFSVRNDPTISENLKKIV